MPFERMPGRELSPRPNIIGEQKLDIPRREIVAAVCFRLLTTDVEFLLVRTHRGRWTFPKGGVQAGLTYAQSAALEAYEEAGVHGRIEETAFLQYRLRRFSRQSAADIEKSVHAHLCEVLRLDSPQETNRNPTWFSSEKAKRRLAEGRTDENAAELARVVDKAFARIRRMPIRGLLAKDPLLKVRFEKSEFTDFPARSDVKALPNPRQNRTLHVPGQQSVSVRSGGKVLQLPSRFKIGGSFGGS
jgi:8-oxo-dGTP pyrophosphatase MutT (NUDIX family)